MTLRTASGLLKVQHVWFNKMEMDLTPRLIPWKISIVFTSSLLNPSIESQMIWEKLWEDKIPNCQKACFCQVSQNLNKSKFQKCYKKNQIGTKCYKIKRQYIAKTIILALSDLPWTVPQSDNCCKGKCSWTNVKQTFSPIKKVL